MVTSLPLIAITRAKIKEGKLDDFKEFTRELLKNIEKRPPQIVAFNVFLNDDETRMTSIQVHPNSRSISP